MNRGDVWWTDFEPAIGSEIRKTRPAVILTVDPVLRARRTPLLVPLSTGPAPRWPIHVATPSIGPRSLAVCDQARALDKTRLIRRIARLTDAELADLESAFREVHGL